MLDRLFGLLFTPWGQEQVRDLLFNFDGRISRAQFWQAQLLMVAITVLVMMTLLLVSLVSTYLAFVLALFACILMLNASIAVGIKRLHDRGKSGWWLVLFYAVPSMLEAIGSMTETIPTVFNLASTALFIWSIVELGYLRGTIGPNKYGPDPLGDSLLHVRS